MAKVVAYDPRVAESENIRNISDEYELFLFSRTIKNCSDGTIKFYRDKKSLIVDWFSSRNLHDLSKITHQDIRLFLGAYQRGHTPNGVFKLFSVFRTFINWYWEEYDLEIRNPITKIEVAKHKLKPVPGITLPEINAMIEVAKHHSDFPERDIAIISVLSETGIRKKGFCSLRFEDVNIEKGEVSALGKNQEWSTKTLGNRSRRALKKYFTRIIGARPSDLIWVDKAGKPINPEAIRDVLKRLQYACGVEEPFLFHGFRRFYGLSLYEATGDIYFVSRMLDHSSVEVTKRYLNIEDAEDKAKAMKYAPLNKRPQ